MTKAATKADFAKFIEMCTTMDKWQEVMNTEKIHEWMIDQGTNTLILRLTSTDFDGIEPELVYNTLLDPEFRHTWDEHLIKRENIEVINPSNTIIYYQFSMPVVSNRDYVFRQSTCKINNDYILYNFSVPNDKYPPNTGKFVRASFEMSGYYIQKTDTGCKVTCIANNDCGGSIPSWLINSQAKGVLPKTVASIKAAALKYTEWKAKHNPDNKPWLTFAEPEE
ncbi:phosphatidylcholine transfer protein, putative [Entamoeba invadens IP1]|uniref:phosphatidylcholine transfer protein, putative n=1 Tax=Entamoeba invadens IP1 TaxID=370355 RepID=UPI0002C3E16A|nr:phosphatidylcholine transfer protein, putative [Entamoeba invadens IP1]ELP85097.1 phosphatidylcholine transfer protein, putative [Entamoeba invadens IP1]|eukprot:XP_004184443.1 phosphatidylcholine transfer protein, putative [Entamoeba invadens IP1]